MRKTYVTEMPNHIGAFLQASEIFASLGVNITRVSYNKAVDSHMLFIDADGSEEKLKIAGERLAKIGYLQKKTEEPKIVLVEFHLCDMPGTLPSVLRLIGQYHFNISYISSREDGSGYQRFKMGLFADDADRLSEFLSSAEKLCPVRVIDYNPSEKVLDNSIFYSSFITGLADIMQIGERERGELLVNANLAMQTLDERGLSPYRTFDSIHSFAKLLSESRGESFKPRVTRHKVGGNSEIIVIEPACGSNTMIIKSGEKLLFVDSGYACYRDEMKKLIGEMLPDTRLSDETVLITHADVDHCGLLPDFGKVIASKKSAKSLRLEYEGQDGLRERNALHKPYIRMCKVLTMYQSPSPEKITVPWERESGEDLLGKIGEYTFGELDFTVYEGGGGHLPGEIVLVDYKNKIAFTGDIYINVKEMTPEQKKYNRYAPILMTSVDTESEKCAAEREKIFNLFGSEPFLAFGSHGAPKKVKNED